MGRPNPGPRPRPARDSRAVAGRNVHEYRGIADGPCHGSILRRNRECMHTMESPARSHDADRPGDPGVGWIREEFDHTGRFRSVALGGSMGRSQTMASDGALTSGPVNDTSAPDREAVVRTKPSAIEAFHPGEKASEVT